MGTWAYDKENTRQVRCKFNRRTDADIIEKLESVGNIQAYIKELIRADIEHDSSRGGAFDMPPEMPAERSEG